MNKMKITFGIMSNKYQIEAYNKLDAYAAMAIFFKRDYHMYFYLSLMR